MERRAEAGIVHLRIVVAAHDAQGVLAALSASPSVINVAHLTGSSVKPPGDLVLCDVVREEVSVVVGHLRDLEVERHGSISIDTGDTTISDAASGALEAAPGSPSDAVIWEEIEARTSDTAELTLSFVAFMVLATLLAAIGIITDSLILLIGAMVLGPEFGPLAGLCVALIHRRFDLAARSGKALAVGFPLAVALTCVMALIFRGIGVESRALSAARSTAFFISHPDGFSVLVALMAGIAGMLSLTTAKSAALIGVLISAATIPAAANIGVAIAYGARSQVGGSLAQLSLNLGCIVVGGLATLAIQRYAFHRRLAGTRSGI